MTNNPHTKIKSTLMVSALALFTTLVACTTDTSAPEQAAPVATSATEVKYEILASYPEGSFLENLEVQADGRLLFTNYFEKTIELLTPNGEKSTFATLAAYPVSLISIEGGYLVTAQTKSFISGEPANMQQFILLDNNGKEVGQFDAPNALFLNGMVKLANGDILVADSVASTIWEVDLQAQKLTPWLQSKLLAPNPAHPTFPGANGLKLNSKGLLVSNTGLSSLFQITMDEDNNPVGEPETFAEVGLVDDFWVNEDGSIVMTTHGNALKSVSADGEITDIISEGCNGCTAVAAYPLGQSSTFVFVNDGGFFFGPKQQSTVVRVTVN